MVRSALALLLGLGSMTLVDNLPAQTAWGPRSPANVPAARSSHVLVHDPVRQRTLLFGGDSRGGPALGDTWEWDGHNWTLLNPSTSPSPRWGAAACFDEVRSRVVLFGGWNGSTAFGDTWQWNGTDWQLLFTVGPARAQHGMAFDSVLRAPVIFGGTNGGTLPADMWQLTSSGWQQLHPPTLPPATDHFVFCADPRRGEILLDGGTANPGTWVWNGAAWLRSTSSRGNIIGSSAAYDGLRRRVVIFGGNQGGALADTWEWDGVAWLRRQPGLIPPARDIAKSVFDEGRQRVLLFGGGAGPTTVFNDTWEYHLFAPADYESFGQGCVGTIGQSPLLAPDDGTLPWIGETWTIDLTRLPPSPVNVPFGVIGTSNTRWLGIPLPVDLGFAGAPGCPLLTSADTSLTPLTNSGGRAVWAITLPLDLRTLGVPFYVQAAVLDYGINPLNLIVSNGGAAVPGMK